MDDLIVCENLMPMCARTRALCPHARISGFCGMAACTNAAIPTFQECFDFWVEADGPTDKRATSVASDLRRFLKAAGMKMTDKIILSAELIDDIHENLVEMKYDQSTIRNTFESVHALAADSRPKRLLYEKRKRNIPVFDFPDIDDGVKEIGEMTEAQRVLLRQVLMHLRASKDPDDHVRFAWLWFAWIVGVRPVDIGRLMWKVISLHDDGTKWLDYIPGKIAPKHAGGKLTPEEYEMIAPFIRAPDEYVIPRLENRIPKTGPVRTRKGSYQGFHKSLRTWINRMMRERIGVTCRNAAYMLRKDCSQTRMRLYGPLHEAQMLGHSIRMAERHYTNIAHVDFAPGL